MSIVDFGKNTQQCGLTFKFDCLGSETISKLVQHYLLKQKIFTSIVKSEGGQQVVLSKGDGSEARPYYQLRLSASELVFLTGWHVQYETWQAWRDQVFSELFLLIEQLPTEYVQGISSQLGCSIPQDKFREPDKIPELQALLAFYSRILPKELMGRGTAYVMSNDAEGKQTVTWWTGGQDVPTDESSVTCSIRLNILDMGLSLANNVTSHSKTADSLFDRFHSNLISLLVKS